MNPPSSSPAAGPPTAAAPSGARGAAGRRARYALQAAALVFAATAVCVLAGLLAARFPARIDATATREHRLSARTEAVLAGLKEPYEIIVAANFAMLEPGTADRTRGVLQNLERASGNVRVTEIDVGARGGAERLDETMRRIVDRFRPQLEAQRKGLGALAAGAAGMRASLTTLSETLLGLQKGVKDEDPNAGVLRRWFGDGAAQCRLYAEELGKAGATASAAAGAPVDAPSTPGADDAVRGAKQAVSQALSAVASINTGLDSMGKAAPGAVAPETAGAARSAVLQVAQVRGALGQALAGLEDLPRTPVGPVWRLLQQTSTAVIVGPPGAARGGVTSLDLSSIFPVRPPEGVPSVPQDLRARAEELLSGALASLSRTDAPIVVLVHGQDVRIAPAFVPLAPLVDRLGLRGVDFAEWAVGMDDEPPSLKALDPKGERPVVWVVASMAPGKADDAARMARLAKAAAKLVGEGRSVLINAVPSGTAAIGQKDAMVEFLEPLGITVDTARPLLRQGTTPRGRVVSPDLAVADPRAEHAVSAALRGQALYLAWAVPVRAGEPKPGVTVTPVVRIEDDGGAVWAESEWQGFLQVPAEQRANLFDPPAPNTSRDDTKGPWTVVAAVERAVGGDKAGGKPQRLLVVGNNKWMDAGVLGEAVDLGGGRTVPAWPGNMELLDAGVSWLAGQDGLIAAGPSSGAVAVIPPLAPGVVTALRWGLVGGVPVLILLVGAVWRLMRG